MAVEWNKIVMDQMKKEKTNCGDGIKDRREIVMKFLLAQQWGISFASKICFYQKTKI